MTDSSSFRRKIYSEIEEFGWEHLVRWSKDLILLSFRVLDAHGRTHVVEVRLDGEYPKHPPSVSGDVPSLPELEWKATSKLKDAVFQFRKQFCFPEDELGPTSGSGTNYTCENASCSRAFHSICLIDWVRSITTTRQSFDVLIGKYPYCSEVIAVNFHKS